MERFNAANAAFYQQRNEQIVAEYDAAPYGQRRAVAAKWGLAYDSLRTLVMNHRKRQRRGGYSTKQWKVSDVQGRLD
jgi:hypothetical protein